MKRFNIVLSTISIIFSLFVFFNVKNDPKIEEISIDISYYELCINETIDLDTLIIPENASQYTSWKSSDQNVATVDSDGYITARGLGQATIIATAKNGMTATSLIKVIPYYIKNIYLYSNYSKIAVGETMQIEASIYPSEVEDKTLTWKSLNPEILTVDQNGTITGVGVGIATITATSENGVTDELIIEVLTEILPTEISLNKTNVEVRKNDTISLSYYFTPGNVTNKNVTWESLNPEIATVDKNGKVYGVKQGTTQIKITLSGGYYAYCTVNVKEVPTTSIIVTNYNDFKNLKIGDVVKIKYQLQPYNSTDDISTITFKSLYTDVAIVDKNGYVTITGKGSTNISISIEGEGKGFLIIYVL